MIMGMEVTISPDRLTQMNQAARGELEECRACTHFGYQTMHCPDCRLHYDCRCEPTTPVLHEGWAGPPAPYPPELGR